MPDLRKKLMQHFYDIWNGVGSQCDNKSLRRMEQICWIQRVSSDGILEVEYDGM